MPKKELAKHLETIERVTAKEWRKQAQDPLGHLSFNEYDYLKVVETVPKGIRLTDLAEQMQVTKASASSMVKRLEAKGLLVSLPAPQDARSKLIFLTDFTKAGFNQDHQVYQVIAQKMLARLDDDQASYLTQLLNQALKDT